MGASKRKGRKNQSEGSSGGGWEIVYSGFVLILLCFFIMLSSFSSMEEAKVLQFVQSFNYAVSSILPGGLKFESGSTVLPGSVDMVDRDDKLAHIFSELEKLTELRKKDNDITVVYSPQGLVMRLSDRALFAAGVGAITPQAIPLLKNVGDIIARTSFEVRIEGHTDDLPINTVQFPSNWELSTARAVNVLRYFIETGAISSQRLSAVGFGEFQPLVPNDSTEHRAQNRRVEIIFLNSDQKPNPLEGRP